MPNFCHFFWEFSQAVAHHTTFCSCPEVPQSFETPQTQHNVRSCSARIAPGPLAPAPVSRVRVRRPGARGPAHVTGINVPSSLASPLPHPLWSAQLADGWANRNGLRDYPEIGTALSILSPHVASLTWQCAWLGSRQRLPPRPPPASCRGRDPPWPQRPRPRQWP